MDYPFFQTSCPSLLQKSMPNLPNFQCITPWITNPIPRFLVPPFPRCIGLNLHLDNFSTALSMLWCFHQVNKYWFEVVNKNVTWNALEMIQIDDKCYFNAINKISLKGDLFKLDLILNSITWISVWAWTTIYGLWFEYGFMWSPNFKVTCT